MGSPMSRSRQLLNQSPGFSFRASGFLILTSVFCLLTPVFAASGERPRDIEYQTAPPAPFHQSAEDVEQKNTGCQSCHTKTDSGSMHVSNAVRLGCVDCHGGDHTVVKPAGLEKDDAAYRAAQDKAHVPPRYPHSWHYPDSANPERSYTLLNKESPEFIRFINPSDYRVVREACGACHLPIIEAAERSLMSTSAMFWAAASYNNGLLPYKRSMLGESYTREGEPAMIKGPELPDANMIAAGVLSELYPLPSWETMPPADIFRVFERGGRNISNLFPDTGLPNVAGQIQRLEEPGRPDVRQSNRGSGTGQRIAVPLLNVHKTRLNDPHTWFMGTNDQPGDYRHSGCASCHVVYANDRDPRHSGPYARHGHEGKSASVDPTISKADSGHPIAHRFTRSIPTSQCMICHMHQPNMFMNTYLGYTMWDYEADAPSMWPEKQQYPDAETIREVNDRNPEGAAPRGKWADVGFLKKVSELNPTLKDTQFADYHGHGWNFRAVLKRDRRGNLLDAKGNVINDNDPKKFDKAVHMSSVHLDKGMHCVDCHYSMDAHGNGHIYGEVAAAVEIGCIDCHGTADQYPALVTSGPASPEGGNDLGALRNPDGKKRFEWRNGRLIQRSVVTPGLEWNVSLVKDSVNPNSKQFNPQAAYAKTVGKNTARLEWGPGVKASDRAHADEEMECYTCHTSWTTGCGGCHLPIEANWKSERHHYEGGETRNFATYNPQVARTDMFQLGRHGEAKKFKIAPVRSSSALVLSSTNANRERIYIQQPPIAASGYSSQAFAPHFPHTTRKEETKTCTDCHLSQANDNNAIMAQLLLQGTGFVNFLGLNAWVGTEKAVEAVRVTEWDEPQAVIGSYLHKYAYPDWYREHQQREQKLTEAYSHRSGPVNCLQLRGEYLFVAEGKKGTRAYDVAGIANKGLSQRIISAPFGPFGHNTRIKSKDATCVVLPTNQPIHPPRNEGQLMREVNLEQPFHSIYNYALITDSREGLILTDVNTLADGEPRNNFLERALTWNPEGVLDGARHLTLGGYYAYIAADKGIVVVNINEPLQPQVAAVIELDDARASALQFRYLFVTDRQGLRVIDVTHPDKPELVNKAHIALDDARRVYLARTYAYIAAGKQGLAIVDIEKPEKPELYMLYTAGGQINDVRDVVVAATNASLFAYLADGRNGLQVVQLFSPASQPKFYGFSPAPKPELIARYATDHPALALSRGLERDRAVDETGNQIAVFGRIGSRPFTLEEMRKLYLNERGQPWYVADKPDNRRLRKR
ncbi:MAG TPA: hypothetical protein VF268_13840 [Gammaproteobacteria bacterium]